MKKDEQREINQIIESEYEGMRQTLRECTKSRIGRLYSCKADMWYSGRYIILYSYESIVAFYNTTNGRLIDNLRMTYGYTVTSAQHITKFHKWLTENNWTVCISHRYYEV